MQQSKDKLKPKSSDLIQTIPSNWEQMDIENFGWEQFQRGEAHQQKKDKEELKVHLFKNLNRATTLSESIFHTAIKDYSVHISKAYLKLESAEKYETLFLVDRNDFLSDKLKEVYKKSHVIKSDFNCEDFYISFKFMPFSNDINEDCIHSDGFTLEYGKGREKLTSCKA